MNIQKDYPCWLKIFIVIIYVFLLVMCSVVAFRSITNLPQENNPQNCCVSIKLEKGDSLSHANTETIDSLINVVSYLNENYKKTNDNLISDIRQETNNIINKINGWLGFWLGIIALVAGIIPVILQWRNLDDLKKESDSRNKESDRLRRKVEGLVEKGDCFIKDTDSKVIEKMKGLDKDFSDLCSELKNELSILSYEMKVKQKEIALTSLINSISIARNNKLIQDSLDSDLLRNRMFERLNKEFEELVGLLLKQDSDYIDEQPVLSSLIQLHSLYKELLPGLVKMRRLKELQKLIDDIRDIIIDMSNGKKCKKSDIHDAMKGIISRMSSVNNLFSN